MVTNAEMLLNLVRLEHAERLQAASQERLARAARRRAGGGSNPRRRLRLDRLEREVDGPQLLVE
jgi:hypothetical protein